MKANDDPNGLPIPAEVQAEITWWKKHEVPSTLNRPCPIEKEGYDDHRSPNFCPKYQIQCNPIPTDCRWGIDGKMRDAWINVSSFSVHETYEQKRLDELEQALTLLRQRPEAQAADYPRKEAA